MPAKYHDVSRNADALTKYCISRIFCWKFDFFPMVESAGDRSTGFDFSLEIALLAIALELVGYLYSPTLNNQSGTFRNPFPPPLS